MRKLIVMFTLMLMSTAAVAQAYFLVSQSYRNGVRTCYYTGGHVLTVSHGRACPYRIVR